jgi:tRNA (guanine-N7-)-methyltransferase
MVSPTYRTEPVSFTRRGGRLTERQQKAWDDLHDSHVVDVPRHGPSTSVDPDFRLDTEAVFGRRAPIVVEIGSGRGEALVAAAAHRPEWDFLGLEVYVPGVAQTLVTMRHRGVENARLAIVNATEALTTMLAPRAVRELWTWFPDPWHKKRHHKRRLVTVPFTALVARVLEPDGVWRFATDSDDYAEVVAEVIAASPHVDGGRVERFDGRAMTRFERKGIAAGRTVHDLLACPTTS